MKLRYCLAPVLLALPLSVSAGAAGGVKTLYRWVDQNGNVHYSDQVPPNAAKDEREVLDKNGAVRKVLPREKTAEELAEEQRKAEQAREQSDYDKSLLKTYSSLEDLKHAGGDRLAAFDDRIQQAEKQVVDTQQQLADLRSRAATAQAGGEDVDPELQRQIQSFESADAQNHAALSQLRQERQRAQDQYYHDVERYTQLQKAGGTNPQP